MPAPAAELRRREGAMLSSAKSSNFCLLLSGPALVAILGKKMERRSRIAMVLSNVLFCFFGVVSCFATGASGKSGGFGASCASAVAATAIINPMRQRED